MPDLATTLAKHPFFAGVPAARVATAARHARWVEWGRGEVVLRTGRPARRVYLLCRGRVAVQFPAEAGRRSRIETVKAGEVLGWSWYVPPYRWRFDAVARTDARAIALPAAWMRAQCARDKTLGNLVKKRTAGIILQRFAAAVRTFAQP